MATVTIAIVSFIVDTMGGLGGSWSSISLTSPSSSSSETFRNTLLLPVMFVVPGGSDYHVFLLIDDVRWSRIDGWLASVLGMLLVMVGFGIVRHFPASCEHLFIPTKVLLVFLVGGGFGHHCKVGGLIGGEWL